MARSAKLRALVVDDNRHVRALVRGLLSALDAEVEECESAVAALSACHAFGPDIVIVDFEMPGMTGAAFTERLRAAEAGGVQRTAVLLMTAHSDAGRVREAARAGVDGLIAKPLSTQALLERVDAALARSASLSPGAAASRT